MGTAIVPGAQQASPIAEDLTAPVLTLQMASSQRASMPDFLEQSALFYARAEIFPAFSLDEPREPEILWTPGEEASFWQAYRARDREMFLFIMRGRHASPSPRGSRQPLLAHAVDWNDLQLLQWLLEAGVDPNTPLQCPAGNDLMAASHGLRWSLDHETGMTPLMLAAALGRTEMIRTLLAYGASRKIETGKNRMIALYFAAQTGKARAVQLLLGVDPDASDRRMTVNISLGAQEATVYKNGEPHLKTRVSTGRAKFATPAGQFVITDKHRSRVSSIYEVEMPYFMRLSCSAIGMHQGHVPSRPASHGCIRLPAAVAKKLFDEIPVGTLVTITQ